MAVQFANAGGTLKVEQCKHTIVNWDKMRIEQVISNLLSNAIRYGERRPVTVRVSVIDAHARIDVCDKGLGIAPEDQERIFERFERIRKSDSEIQGLGLGLFITKRIVLSHGGRIWVESEVGKGSCFCVELPLGSNCQNEEEEGVHIA